MCGSFWCVEDRSRLIRAIQELAERSLKDWKKADHFQEWGQEELKHIQKTTTTFIKKVEKQGLQKDQWQGASPEWQNLMQEYKHEILPVLTKWAAKLPLESEVRKTVEKIGM